MVDLAAFPARCAGFERNPAERAANPARFAPVQPGLLELPAAGHVFPRHFLQGLRVQAQLLAGPLGIAIQVVGRQKDLALADRAMAKFVQVVPDKIHAARHLPQQRRMLVSNANLEGLGVIHGNSVPQHRNNPKAASRPRYAIQQSKCELLRNSAGANNGER